MIAAFVLALAAAPLAATASANISASSYDVSITLTPDGSLDVHESIAIDVGPRTISWFERDVPDRFTDGITNVVASMDGHELGSSGTPAVRVTTRRGANVRWQFAPTSNARHVFELRYRATRLLVREIDGYALNWTALPANHTYPINAASVSLSAPAGTVATGLTAEGGTVASSPAGGALITAANLSGRRDTLTLHLMLAPNSIAPIEGQWHIRQERNEEFTPAWIFAACTLIVVAVGILVMAFAQLKRAIPRVATADDTRAPAQIGAAEAAALINRGAVGSWLVMQAAFFALVRDGQLAIRPGATSRRGRSFVVTTTGRTAATPHEQWLVDLVGRPGTGTDLQGIVRQLGRRRREFVRLLADRMVALGYLDVERRRTSSGIRTTGLVVLVSSLIGAMVFAAFVPELGEVPLVVPAASFVAGLLYLAVPGFMTVLSPEGAAEARAWDRVVAELREQIARPDDADLRVVERAMPLAIGAGLGRPWMRAFGDRLAAGGRDAGWMAQFGDPAEATAALHAIVAITGATAGSAVGGGAGAAAGGAGGGSSSAG